MKEDFQQLYLSKLDRLGIQANPKVIQYDIRKLYKKYSICYLTLLKKEKYIK